MKIENLIRDNIKRLMPYSSARDERGGEATIYLDANENPYETEFNRYPDPYQVKLKKAISAFRFVPEENIFLGNGSDEIIDLLIRLVCEPGISNVLSVRPSYGMYKVSAQINNIEHRETDLSHDFSICANAVLKKCDDNTKLIFLCSPNNPTGNLLVKSEVIKIIEKFEGLVVIDEAYIDYSQDEGWVKAIQKYSNLVVLQTLSKAFGLATLRLGMGFAPTLLVDYLNKIKPPYNINGLTQKYAAKAIEKVDLKGIVQSQIDQRTWLVQQLKTLNVVRKIYPSDSNFILVEFENAELVYAYLRDKGIIVRNRSDEFMCENCLRISVGTVTENKELVSTIKLFKNEESIIYR